MGHNVNVMVSSSDDGTLRQNVPDRLMHLTISWLDNTGTPQTHSGDYYLLPEIAWLKANHPDAAKAALQDLVLRIVRLRLGVDGSEGP